jgi:hypothetical protein
LHPGSIDDDRVFSCAGAGRAAPAYLLLTRSAENKNAPKGVSLTS